MAVSARIENGDRLKIEVTAPTGEIFSCVVAVVDNTDGGLDWLDSPDAEEIEIVQHTRPTYNPIGVPGARS